MDLLNIPAALTYPQWGQTAGQNIRQNALYQQGREDQQAVLARQSEQQQYERGLVAQKLTQEQHDALVNQFAGAIVNSQTPAADYGPLRARYLQTVQASHPELAAALSSEIPEQFSPDIVADARGHLGIKPEPQVPHVVGKALVGPDGKVLYQGAEDLPNSVQEFQYGQAHPEFAKRQDQLKVLPAQFKLDNPALLTSAQQRAPSGYQFAPDGV